MWANGMESEAQALADCFYGLVDANADLAAQAQQESKELGQPYGIVDPDYARIYTQSRIIAWQYGYSCLMHGSFTRDLDLLLVPWEDSASNNHDQLLKLIADACGLQFKDGEKEIYKAKVDWTTKPHGRKSCSLFFKEATDRRWIDIAVLSVSLAPEGGEKQRPSADWYRTKVFSIPDNDIPICPPAPEGE